MSRIALVAGATGLVGGHLLKQLLAFPVYGEVRVLGRRAPEQQHPKLHALVSDYSNLEQLLAQLRVDDVFCCLGTTLRKAGSKAAFEKVDYEYVLLLARAAKAAGARQFLVISAAGTSERATTFYSRVKARMEKDVAAIGFNTTHILRPSLLLGARTESRPGERLGQLLSPLLAPLLSGPLKKYRPIEAADVASAMLGLALKDETGVHVHHLPLAD